MKRHHAHEGRPGWWRAALLALVLAVIEAPAFAAGSVTVQVGEGGFQMSSGKAVYTMSVGVVTTVELVVAGAKVSQPIQWPAVDGLTLNGSGSDPHRNAFTFFLTPERAGDFTVPAFDVHADGGQTLHVGPIKFHAVPHS